MCVCVWNKHLISNRLVEMYMDFACCAAVPGGGRNKEYALHLLHLCKGNVQVRQQNHIYKPAY